MGEELFPLNLLSNYVAVEMVPKKKSVILTPETVKPALNTMELRIVAISDEKEKDGTPMVRIAKVGDKVILNTMVLHTGQEIIIAKKPYVVVRETELVGIFRPDYAEPEEQAPILTLVN